MKTRQNGVADDPRRRPSNTDGDDDDEFLMMTIIIMSRVAKIVSYRTLSIYSLN